MSQLDSEALAAPVAPSVVVPDVVKYGRYVAGHTTPDVAYDALADIYDTAYLSPKDLAENNWVATYLSGHGYCDGNVLDVGCGTGLLLELCDVRAQGYVGLDVSDEMLRKARTKHPGYEFVKGDMADLDSVVAPWSIDNAIYMFGVFSYAIDQKAAVESLATTLRPGGKFIVMALSHRYPDRASYSVAQAGFSVPIVTYDADSLFDLFDDTGSFDDLRMRGLSLGVDRLNWMGPSLLSAVYRLDARIGTKRPSSGAYVCIEGRLR